MAKEAEFLMHNDENQGWDFNTGDPELWHYRDQLVVVGGKALELGIGSGADSLFLAIHGMDVVGYDTSQKALETVGNTAAYFQSDMGLPISLTAYQGDIKETELGENRFDTIIAPYTFVHFDSKESAFAVLDKAYAALKRGGHIWVRTIGKADAGFTELKDEIEYDQEVTQLNEDVIAHPCTCSGDYEIHPVLFFDPADLLQYFVFKGARIIDSQIMPKAGAPNILFGEDWQHNGGPRRQWGFITLLAQKPSV